MKVHLKYIKMIVLGLVLLSVASFLVFNEYGILKYFKLKNEVNTLHYEIDRIAKENKILQDEIDSLRNNIPAKIEKIAREKYHMHRKGETAIEVREK